MFKHNNQSIRHGAPSAYAMHMASIFPGHSIRHGSPSANTYGPRDYNNGAVSFF